MKSKLNKIFSHNLACDKNRELNLKDSSEKLSVLNEKYLQSSERYVRKGVGSVDAVKVNNP